MTILLWPPYLGIVDLNELIKVNKILNFIKDANIPRNLSFNENFHFIRFRAASFWIRVWVTFLMCITMF